MPSRPILAKIAVRPAKHAESTAQTNQVGVSSQGRHALKAILAISIGAALGALLRWVLALKLNSLFPEIPPGTLVANLIGAYVIGVAIAYFAKAPDIPGEWRLLIITGFCGGLTTFSTFSAEVVSLLQQGRAAMAGSIVAVHVIGSVTMTFLGIGSYAWVNAD
jgi:CrcB protein